jgi:hypothetical protein
MMDNLFPRPNTLLMHLRGTCYINNKCRKGKKKKENHNLLPYSFTFIPSFFFLNSGLRSRTWAVGLPPTTVLGFFSPREVPSLCSRCDQLRSSSTPRRHSRCPRCRPSSSSRRAQAHTFAKQPRTRRTRASWRGARTLPRRGGRRRRSSARRR